MAITAKDVAALREKTGVGMMECKKALTEANGDMDKAVELLREKGLAAAAKKAGRIAAEGIVDTYVTDSCGVVLEVNSETDFVGKNEAFRDFVAAVAKQVADKAPADVDALYEMSFDANPSMTVREALNEKIATIGENMNIRRFDRYEGVTEGYVHGGGRIGVLVEFKLGDNAVAASDAFKAYAKDICMQVAAAAPQFTKKDDVPAETVEKEKEILKAQALNEGKPEAIVEKMVMGRIQKYYKEVCLVEQPFIKDPDKSVTAYTKDAEKELGTTIEIVRFSRMEKGEGLEKREDNFAEEVANMMK